jgi:lysophospholipase L1-like esterase
MTPCSFQCALVSLSVLVGPLAARGELLLANYSQANPIKIMAVGDSITDDCVFNGAWRQYLPPLLETNGYPFVFVGRETSSPSGSFTNTRHEGFCGAVIAPPGVMSSAVHGYAGSDVYLQKIVHDALTNATPDLVLLLIGVNDIGRGRDPFLVATNDMPNLLDMIFASAPNANIILAKVTSLRNASIPGLNYAAYATNISSYNAALQAMVNQRRALGQNVSLADMFSAVDFNTMYNSDHVHPNTAGLQAIAQEWLARIQTITVCSNLATCTLIPGGAVWKYSDTGLDLGTNWAQPGYVDSTWGQGPARLGYGDPAVATTVGFGLDATNRHLTTYFRHWFTVPEGIRITNLNFRLLSVDGAVVWLNGREAFRTNMPGGSIAYTNLAVRPVVFDAAYTFYPTNLAAPSLLRGMNLVAAEVHLRTATRIALGFDLELLGAGYYVPPTLSITLSGGTISVRWPAANSAGYTLYSTTNLTAATPWTPTTGAVTNGSEIVVTEAPEPSAKFYSLRKP